MQSTDVVSPLAIGSPIALNGDKNIPPQNASGTDTSSINLGFLPITSEPLDDGGVAPERVDFNGMFYLSTDQRVFLQNGGVITYDATVASAIGGYPAGAILGYIDGSGNLGIVRSLIDNNQYNFVTNPSYINGTYWEYAYLLNLDIPLTGVVKITGAQTVTGNKTFTGTVALNGTSTATTQAYGTNNTRIATTAFTKSARNINWSSGVTVTAPYSSNKYTAPYDGVYIAFNFKNQGFSNLYINGVETKVITGDSADGASYSNIFVPLKSGDVIYWASTLNSHDGKFYKYQA